LRKVRKLSRRQYCKIYSLVPRMTIDLIIFYKGGLVLSKRDIPPCKGMWHLPGATMLLGETLFEAAKRIAKEEVNIAVNPLGIAGIKEYSRKTAFGQVVAIVFIAKGIRGQLHGNEYAREVDVFTKLPRRMIKEQRDMLISLGIVDSNGLVKISSDEELKQFMRNLITFEDRLWKCPHEGRNSSWRGWDEA